jgi:hypothetical protein
VSEITFTVTVKVADDKVHDVADVGWSSSTDYERPRSSVEIMADTVADALAGILQAEMATAEPVILFQSTHVEPDNDDQF